MTPLERSPDIAAIPLTPRAKQLVVAAALLALFLGALDALVVGSAMPTIVADLGGLEFYSWVFSTYLLTRAVALPIFGKLCDLYDSRNLFIAVIALFVASSALAGMAQSMSQLITFRAIQGIGAGGNFALTYYIVTSISEPEKRGKMLGMISFVWGVSSLLGPPLGGFIVNYASWRWIFLMNIPLGGAALLGILAYLKETRDHSRKPVIDFAGAFTLSCAVITLLTACLLAGKSYSWLSPTIIALLAAAIFFTRTFIAVEKRAVDPLLPLSFFRVPSFRSGNLSAFWSSFAIFSLAAFFPLFIQGAMGKSPAELGMLMIPLSLGWSIGAWMYGQVSNRFAARPASVSGALLLMTGSALSLTLSPGAPLLLCVVALTTAGLGMGFVSISTLLAVQRSLPEADLGIATASHQFARTLGGTIGIGVSGSLATAYLQKALLAVNSGSGTNPVNPALLATASRDLQNLFRPEIQKDLPAVVKTVLHGAVVHGVGAVFWLALAASAISLAAACTLPAEPAHESPDSG